MGGRNGNRTTGGSGASYVKHACLFLYWTGLKKVTSTGPRLSAAAPSTKGNCPGYGRYRVLDMAGFRLVQTVDVVQVVHGGQEWEPDDGRQWASGAGRNGQVLGRPA